MQKIWKLVNIWQSYRELKGGNFFWDTVYDFLVVTNSNFDYISLHALWVMVT